MRAAGVGRKAGGAAEGCRDGGDPCDRQADAVHLGPEVRVRLLYVHLSIYLYTK